MSSSARALRRRTLSIVVLILPGLLAGCASQGLSFLSPAGPVARGELSHFITITLISLIAIVPVFVLVPILLWRYRLRGGKGQYAPRWEYARALELIMWGVPVAIVAVLGWQLVRNTYMLDPYRRIDPEAPAIRIEAVAMNWKWLFIYPEQGIATVDHLTIPIGTPVEFRLTSDSVMQSFMISALAGQIYVMPGMETRQFLRADTPGTYIGRNTQYNGPGFAGQRFEVSAVEPVAFENWVADTRAARGTMDQAAYAILAEPSTGAAAAERLGLPTGATIGFGQVQSDLYASILHRYMSPAGVSVAAQPGAPGYSSDTAASLPHHATGGTP